MYHMDVLLKTGLIMLLLLIAYVFTQIGVFKVKLVKVVQQRVALKKSIDIIQITDYHENRLINKRRLLRMIKKINPDIIVLTGDIINDNTKDLCSTIELLEEIKRINSNVYSVSGNHEIRSSLGEEFKAQLEDIGIENLEYKCKILNIDEMKIKLCGLPFNINKLPNDDWHGEYSNLLTVLISHSPKTAIECENIFYDLALSGHMHGGQVRIPLIGAIVTPYGGLFPKYNKGLYRLEDRYVYVDSGLGNSAYPLRTFNRVQISHIKIMNEK